MKEDSKGEVAQQDELLREQGKQPYSAPQLTIHGTVEKLTQLGVGVPPGDMPLGSLPA